MIRGLFRFIYNVLRMFVRLLDLVVRGVFYALLIFGIGVLVAFFFHPEPEVPAGSALVLRPVGTIVEQAELEPPLALLRAGGAPAGQIRLADLTKAVRSARDDERIAARVIETDELVGGGLS